VGEVVRLPGGTVTLQAAVEAFLDHYGSADPMFPLGHGEALAGEIPGRGCCRSREPGTGSTEPTGTH
jgi:hypothetical protein